jgi:hypothetical protein
MQCKKPKEREKDESFELLVGGLVELMPLFYALDGLAWHGPTRETISVIDCESEDMTASSLNHTYSIYIINLFRYEKWDHIKKEK